MDQNIKKKEAALKALEIILPYVNEGTILGIGTGSTTNFFIEELISSKIKINLSNLKLTVHDDHSKYVKLTDTISIEMKYPTMSVYNRMSAMDDVENASTINELFNIIIDCIDNIYSGDEIFSASDHTTEEMNDFINSLTSDQFDKLKTFFNTMPVLVYDIQFTCPKCNCLEKQTLNGVADFFL